MDLVKKIQELIDEGIFDNNYEERRRPYPGTSPNWFDCLDGSEATGRDKKSGGIPAPSIEGKPTKTTNNPLRGGDNSTII